MAARNYTNVAVATDLDGSVTDVATSWTVTDGSTYPAVPFTARCEDEVVLVTAKSGTNDVNWTVTRAYDGTTGASHADAAAVEHVVIAADFSTGWELIERTSITSNTTSITWSNIPQTFEDLQIRWRARCNVTGTNRAFRLQVGNGSVDTGSNYKYFIENFGTIGTGGDATGGTTYVSWRQAFAAPGTTAPSNAFGQGVLTINDYAGAYLKSAHWDNVLQGTSSQIFRVVGGGFWLSTSAIDTLKIQDYDGSSNDLVAGSVFSLYGIR